MYRSRGGVPSTHSVFFALLAQEQSKLQLLINTISSALIKNNDYF